MRIILVTADQDEPTRVGLAVQRVALRWAIYLVLLMIVLGWGS